MSDSPVRPASVQTGLHVVAQANTAPSVLTSVTDHDDEVRTKPVPGSFLFIEYITVVEGTGSLPELRLDFPRYIFNPEARLLRALLTPFPPLASDAVGYLGVARQRKGAAGTGVAASIQTIYSLPYAFEAQVFSGSFEQGTEIYGPARVVLEGFGQNGNLIASIAGESVSLVPGQSWEKLVEADSNDVTYNGHIKVMHRLKHHGELPVGSIQFP